MGVILVLFISVTAAAEFQTDALEIDNGEAEFHDDTITLRVTTGDGEELEMNLTPQQLFVPDEISDHATLSGYNYVDAPTGELVEWTGYQYDTGWTHEDPAVMDLLAWGEGGGVDAGSKYPANFFQIGAYSSDLTGQNGAVADVFDYDFREENDGYNVSWEIDVSSHNEYLVLDYTLYYETVNGTGENENRIRDRVHTWTDAYKVGDAKKLRIFGDAQAIGNNLQQQTVTVDNLHGRQDWKQLFLVHEPGASVDSVNFEGRPYNECSLDYQDNVVPELDTAGVTEYRVDSVDGLHTTCYNVSIPADTRQELTVTYQEEPRTQGTFSLSNDYQYHGYILGSAASYSVSSQTDWESEGTLMNTTADSGTLKLLSDGYIISGHTLADSLDISGATSGFTMGLDFSNDGTTLVVQSWTNGFSEYSLSTPFDLSTATHEHNQGISEDAGDIAFNDDGTKLFTGDWSGNVHEYHLSTAYDVSTASHERSTSVQSSTIGGIDFADDGTKMFIADNSGNDVEEYDLSTAYDISSVSHVTDYSHSEFTDLEALTIDDSGNKMFVTNEGNEQVVSHRLGATATLTSGATHLRTIDVSDGNTPRGVSWDDTGLKFYTVEGRDLVKEYSTDSDVESEGQWISDVQSLIEGPDDIVNVTVDATVPDGAELNLVIDGKNSDGVTQEADVIAIDQDGEHNYTTDIGVHEDWQFTFNMTRGSTPEVNSFTVYSSKAGDETSPSITTHHPENQTYSTSILDLNVTTDEAVDVWQYSLNGAANQTFTPNTTLTGLSDGQHHLEVYAEDAEGNTGNQDVHFTVDTTPPQWQQLQDNASSLISAGTIVNISVDWIEHGSGVTEALLATNQTGTFHNVTATTREDGFEDNDLSQNFTWEIHKGSLDLTNISVHNSADARTGSHSLRLHIDDSDGESYSNSNDWVTVQTPVETGDGNETFQLSTKFYEEFADPDYVAKSIGFSDGSAVEDGYDVDYRVLFGDDIDANSQEIQIDGTSYGDYVKDSYYTVTFDVTGSDQMDITVGNSTHEFQKTVSGPSIESMENMVILTEPEATSYPYEHYMFVDDVKITENVGAISADDGSYRPMYFDNTTGNSILTDFLWSDASFDGLLGYRIWASDSAGNWNVTDTGTLAVNQPPSLSNLQATPDPVEAGDVVNITVTVTDPDANTDTVRLNLTDPAAAVTVENAAMNAASGDEYWYAYTPAVDQSSLGEWTIDIEATDTNGALATETGTFTVQDTESPTITYQGSTTPATTVAQDWIFFNVSATDNIGVDAVSRELDGANTSIGNDAGMYYWINETGLSDGTYTLQGFANDTSDNVAATNERSITLDTTAPNITVHSPENTAYTTDTVTLDLTADETVDTWRYSLDGEPNTTVQPNTTLSGLADGSYTITVYATDSAGNTGEQTQTFTVDTTAPNISYNPSSTAAGTYSQDWILVNVSVADNLAISSVTEAFDDRDGRNDSFANVPGGGDSDNDRDKTKDGTDDETGEIGDYWTNHSNLKDGTYTYKAYAEDDAGNTNSTDERSITLDTTPPSTSDNWTVSGWQNQDIAHIELTASDTTTAIDQVSYRVDGGDWTTVSGSTATVTISSDGNHTLEYNATDTTANTESTNTAYVALDTTPPAVSYTTGSTAAGSYNQDWIFINLSATDTYSGVDWVRETFDGTNSTFANTSGQYHWENHTGLADGTYTVRGWANDTVSNSLFTTERTVTLDTTAPTITLHDPRNSTYNSSTVPLNVSADESMAGWKYSLDGGPNTTFTPNSTLSSLAAGTYTLAVYGTDASGNTARETVTFTTAPEPYVVLREGVTLRQPDNNVAINVTSTFNVSNQLRVFSDATQFDATNWSITGSTADLINIHLDWFNGSATDEYAANYSVDTADENTVTFSWVNAVVDTFYDVFVNGLFDTQEEADANGDVSFTYDDWTSGYDNFSLLHSPNGVPRITSTLFRDDRKQDVTRLEFDLDDRGDADLRSYRGDGSATTFTNSSLAVDILLPVTSIYNITDREGRTSPGTAVSVTETDSGLQEDAHPHTLDTQQVNRSVTVCNNEITGLGYNLTFATYGTAVTAESFNGTIPATECVTETGIWSGDWLTNEQEIVHKRGQNGSRISNSSRQHFYTQTAFQADNSQSFQFIGVDLSTDCNADAVGTAGPGTSNLTTNCNNDTVSGDFINDTEFGFNPEPETAVTLGLNYYGHRQLQLNNTEPVAWSAINTTTGVTPPTKCTQTNNTLVGLAAGVTTNYTVRFSCPPGTLGSGTQEVKNISSDKERVWFNISGIEVYTNHTEDLQFRREVDKDNLKNPNERDGGTLEAYADGNQINVSIRDESDKFVIVVGRNHTNSSWHKGTHTTALTYTLSDDSTTIIEDGGSGGSGGSGPTTIIRNVTGDAYSWTVSTPGSGSQRFQFFGYPGRTFNAPLELENTGSGPVNLSLQCISSDGSCDWVELSTDHVQFDASSFTETTVTVQGQVPLNASENEYNFVVRVTDPSYDPQNPEAGGKGDVRFSVDMNRPLGFLIERYGRLAGIYTTIEAPDRAPLPEDAHGVPIPFILIPLFFSGAVFAVARAVDDSGGAILAAHILLAVFVFILAAGLFPAWPIL